MFDAVLRICFEIIHGLYWLVKTGWNIWASLFDFVPYGNPYLAAVVAALVVVVVHRIVVPRAPRAG